MTQYRERERGRERERERERERKRERGGEMRKKKVRSVDWRIRMLDKYFLKIMAM